MSRPEIPSPHEVYNLKRVLEPFRLALEACIQLALDDPYAGSVDWDEDSDLLYFHCKVKPILVDVLPILHGVEEVWIELRDRQVRA